MKMLPTFLCFSLLALSCTRKPAIEHTTYSLNIFQSRQTVIGTKQFAYRVYVPKDRKDGEKLPVMLYLHGSEERGDDNEGQLSGPAPIILANPDNFRFIIVFPQCPIGRIWDKEMIESAIAELDQTVKDLNGDATRLYLAGFSLGGYGTWTAGAMYPDKFAALVSMSGRLLPRPEERKNVAPEILVLADASDPFVAFAGKLCKKPIWIFHGTDDPIVPVKNSRQMAKALIDVGNENARYTELENTGHVSLNAAFSNPELFNWLAEQHLSDK